MAIKHKKFSGVTPTPAGNFDVKLRAGESINIKRGTVGRIKSVPKDKHLIGYS